MHQLFAMPVNVALRGHMSKAHVRPCDAPTFRYACECGTLLVVTKHYGVTDSGRRRGAAK